jgi:2-polyprenyl-6-hydroxyphenyl methylase/3-demethylubiquinone-9 3-methyltransferase
MNSEVIKFNSIADEWWNIDGPFKTLHQINPTRLTYIVDQIGKNFTNRNLNILDIGCGGGLVSIPLSKLGYNITGIDLGNDNIDIANKKALEKNLEANFMCKTLYEIEEKFDVILCLEVLEHVEDIKKFICKIATLLKPGAIVIFSTINRNIQSLLQNIVIAEYILNIVPKGTHSFSKFIKPFEIHKILEELQIKIHDICGMSYNIRDGSWFISDDVSANYFITAKL